MSAQSISCWEMVMVQLKPQQAMALAADHPACDPLVPDLWTPLSGEEGYVYVGGPS